MGVVLPMDFLRLPLVAVLGFWLYGESVGLLFVLGTGLILLGNWVNMRSARPPLKTP